MKRYIFFVVFLMITPLANAQNEILRNIFPQVADGVFGEGGYYLNPA